MAEVEQPLQKRPRVEEITTSGKTVTPTTKMGDISALTVRPKQRGTLGNPIAAISNQYLLRIASETQFFLYEADIKEKYARENDPVGLTKSILQSVLNQMKKEKFENTVMAVAPPNLVISGTRLKDPETGETGDEINLVVNVPKPNERKRREFEVHLRLTRSAPQFGPFYEDYKRNTMDHANEMFAMRTSMNVIFHSGQRERALTTKGPWHYTATDSARLSDTSIMLRSYTQAVMDSDAGMVLTFGTSAGCFKLDMPLEEYLKELFDWRAFKNETPQEIQKVERFLKREKIKCTFMHQTKSKREPETIKGLAFNEQGRLMKVQDVFFPTKDAEHLVKRMQRAAKEANNGERTDEISMDAIKAAFEALNEKNALKANPPPDSALASMFESLAGGSDKVDIKKMVDLIAPPISMVDYFKKAYNIDLIPEVPVFWTGSAKRKSFHYLMHAYMVAGQAKNKMDPRETDQMIRNTSQRPNQRCGLIAKLKKEAAYDTDQALMDFKIQVSPEPIIVRDARVLPIPVINVTERESVRGMKKAGDWDHRTNFYTPAKLQSWAILITDRRAFNGQAIESFIYHMKNCFLEKGISWTEPVLVEPVRGNAQCLEKQMIEFKEAAERKRGMPLELLVVFKGPDGANGVFYSEIKRVGDMVLGIPTTCCNAKKALSPAKNQGKFVFPYVKGVVLKINTKLGNLRVNQGEDFKVLPASVNWAVTIPWKCKTMVVGIDVSHPSPGSRQPSVLAVTALVDRWGHGYVCRYKACSRRMEIGGVQNEDFHGMIEGLITDFAKVNEGPPQSILVFRDGVSESQFAHVKETEVQAFKNVAEELSGGIWKDLLKGESWSPSITYVVCQKRNQARFMPEREDPRDRSGNLPAGFVVDTQIVSKSLFDFYLISHSGLQGTSRPVHYFVLEDQMDYTADEIQAITYALCYGYARCTKSIGCVTPIYYADKIAERVRMYYNEADDLMSDAGTVCSRTSDEELPTRYVHLNLRMSMFWA